MLRNVDHDYILCLYTKFSNLVHSVAFNILRNKPDAEDCHQRVFCLAMEKCNDLRTHTAPEKWLAVTARNISYEILRDTLPSGKINVSLDDPSVSIVLAGSDASEELLEKEASEKMSELNIPTFLTNLLSEQEYILFCHRYRDRQKLDFIATTLGIKKTTASMRIARLRNKIIVAIQKTGH